MPYPMPMEKSKNLLVEDALKLLPNMSSAQICAKNIAGHLVVSRRDYFGGIRIMMRAFPFLLLCPLFRS